MEAIPGAYSSAESVDDGKAQEQSRTERRAIVSSMFNHAASPQCAYSPSAMIRNGSHFQTRSHADRADGRVLGTSLSAGREKFAPASPFSMKGLLAMHILVDLKVCEACGSLWYRASGGVIVYCTSCALKLGEFPKPRTRRRPGGRRKKMSTASGLFKVLTAGGVR